MADATREIYPDDQRGIEVKITTPPKMTENATKYLSQSLPDLTNPVAHDANNGVIVLDDESSGIDESQTDVHAYLEEQRRRLEAVLGADRSILVRNFQCFAHFFSTSLIVYIGGLILLSNRRAAYFPA